MKTFYYLMLALSLLFASCDSPTDTKKSSSSRAQTTKGGGGEQAGTKLSFPKPALSQVLRAPFTETYTNLLDKVVVTGDQGEVTYTSNDTDVATVDRSTGAVKPLSVGKTTITATKEATAGKWQKSTAKYTLTIVKFRPTSKAQLASEIKEATKPGVRGMSADLNYIDTSAITDMSSLFMADLPATPRLTEGYELSAFAGDISGWDVSSVINMTLMFSGATEFNQDISDWDVSSVTNMTLMFSGATEFNQDISTWDVSSVTNMAAMFLKATEFTQNLNNWGDKLNRRLKEFEWVKTTNMFRDSGLKDSLPEWCKNSRCKERQS